ncbi:MULTISPECIES: JAB domain-containing protein [Enterobacteriaceae]|uniref:JAB domain-containing protein n=1 Tax=Enterobacteriaceae TaxID=543 RepID=UPI00351BB61F
MSFTSSNTMRDWLRQHLATQERESLMVLWLDNQHRVTAHDTQSPGTINNITVHPRKVVKDIIFRKAQSYKSISTSFPTGITHLSFMVGVLAFKWL